MHRRPAPAQEGQRRPLRDFGNRLGASAAAEPTRRLSERPQESDGAENVPTASRDAFGERIAWRVQEVRVRSRNDCFE